MANIRTTVDGLRAIELDFRPIIDSTTGKPAFYLVRTHLNTPDKGVLLPEVFRPVAETVHLSGELFRL